MRGRRSPIGPGGRPPRAAFVFRHPAARVNVGGQVVRFFPGSAKVLNEAARSRIARTRAEFSGSPSGSLVKSASGPASPREPPSPTADSRTTVLTALKARARGWVNSTLENLLRWCAGRLGRPARKRLRRSPGFRRQPNRAGGSRSTPPSTTRRRVGSAATTRVASIRATRGRSGRPTPPAVEPDRRVAFHKAVEHLPAAVREVPATTFRHGRTRVPGHRAVRSGRSGGGGRRAPGGSEPVGGRARPLRLRDFRRW